MTRSATRSFAAMVLAAGLGLAWGAMAPALAEQQYPADPSRLIYVKPQDVNRAEASTTDGNVVSGGHYGAQPGCPGVQAFIEKTTPSGSRVWLRNASAGEDCDADGLPDPGEPLFGGMTSLDPAYIVSSTVQSVVAAANGTSFTTGQLLIAWQNGGALAAAWGAFLVQHDAEGHLLADLYFGAEPNGAPTEAGDCFVLCAALRQAQSGQWGGRLIALEESPSGALETLYFAGWHLSAANQGINGKDVFVASLAPGLGEVNWLSHLPYLGKDEPRALVLADSGDLYVTGFFGPDQDVFVGRFAEVDGALTHLFTGGGAQDDEGDSITLDAAGDIVVEGSFIGQATFGGHVLEGYGENRFRLELTPNLQLTSAEVVEVDKSLSGANASFATPLSKQMQGNPPPPPLPPPDPMGNHINLPEAVRVLVGEASSGTSPSLVSDTDDQYLTIKGESEPDFGKVEVVFDIPIHQGAPVLTSVEMQFRSDYCTALRVLLGGGDDTRGDRFHIGGTGICPYDEPLITVEVPQEIAEQLGFGPTLAQPRAPLEVVVEMEIYSSPCNFCSSPEEDEQINSVHCNSEYP